MPDRPRTGKAGESLDRVEAAVHEVIRALAPELRVERRWGHPWYVGNDLVVLPGTFSKHVGVEFWRGTSLRDPTHLLQGTGKNLRHARLRSTREATSPAMIALLREAVELDRRTPPRDRSNPAPSAPPPGRPARAKPP